MSSFDIYNNCFKDTFGSMSSEPGLLNVILSFVLILTELIIVEIDYYGRQLMDVVERFQVDYSGVGTHRTVEVDTEDDVADAENLVYLEGFDEESSEVHHLCSMSGQSSVLPWHIAMRHLDLSEATVIGEGSYGTVYAAKLNGINVALKVVTFRESDDPTRKYPFVNGCEMMSAAQIIPEVVTTKALSDLSKGDSQAPNFVQLHETFIVRGPYPKELLNAWHAFNKENESENTCPIDFDSTTRHYIVMVLGFGGVDLETFELQSCSQASSILLQVALALAVAEVELEFEHRDLHWGNILICEEDVPEFIEYVIEGKEIRVRSHGVKVVIIDFTNSRVSEDGVVVFADLSEDPELFEGSGDSQFQVYRDMQALNGVDWSVYTPKSNVLWLEYLIDKLFNGSEEAPSNFSEKQRDEVMKKLSFVRDCSSALDFLKKSSSIF